jgi:hypothetical protein
MKNPARVERKRKTTFMEVSRQMRAKKRDRSALRPPGIGSIMLERPLTLASLNVRGLRGDTPKPKEIKAWMASLADPPQILLIQEHHLCKKGVQRFGKKMEFWNGIALWNEGIPMGRYQRTNVGTVILVDRATSPYIKDHSTLVGGRAQYVTLLSPEGGSTSMHSKSPTRGHPSGGKSHKKTSTPITYWWGAISITLKKSPAGEYPARDKSIERKLRPGIR